MHLGARVQAEPDIVGVACGGADGDGGTPAGEGGRHVLVRRAQVRAGGEQGVVGRIGGGQRVVEGFCVVRGFRLGLRRRHAKQQGQPDAGDEADPSVLPRHHRHSLSYRAETAPNGRARCATPVPVTPRFCAVHNLSSCVFRTRSRPCAGTPAAGRSHSRTPGAAPIPRPKARRRPPGRRRTTHRCRRIGRPGV